MPGFIDFDFTVLTRLPTIQAALFHVALSMGMSVHVLLRKRDSKSAFAWLGVIWLSPVIGAVSYWMFGINRITRKAAKLKIKERRMTQVHETLRGVADDGGESELPEFTRLVNKIIDKKLLPHNQVRTLFGGEQAYPEMIAAIHAAKRSICMQTYIMNWGQSSHEFVEALQKAMQRGVQVRLLIDGVGARYRLPSIASHLRRAKIPHAYFLNSIWPWQFGFFNLRNHRKLMIVDGKFAFTGGLNIRDRHDARLLKSKQKYTEDIHFSVRGPVVGDLMESFAQDWFFTTGEVLNPSIWYTQADIDASVPANSWCRLVSCGPDEEFERSKWVLIGALKLAKKSVRICTPYFVPDTDVVTALRCAALAGVLVELIVPEKNNVPLVQWASMTIMPQIVKSGCRVYMSPPPFDHSKLMIVDDAWSFVGSANWDARSLRLNFEMNLEVHDVSLAQVLAQHFDTKRAASKRLTRADLKRRSTLLQLRDNAARMFSPYL